MSETINGWTLDVETLPHWNLETNLPHGGTEAPLFLLESSHDDVACLLYATMETRMSAYVGALAVFQNKQAPELLLSIRYVYFEQYAYFSDDGKFLFLKAIYRYGKRFVLLLNLRKKAYAILHFSPPDHDYQIRPLGNEVFEIFYDTALTMRDEKLQKFNHIKVDCRQLRWKSWNALSKGDDLNLQRRGLDYAFKSKEKIWTESLELLRLDAISAQEFVDLNRDKTVYYFSPFKTDRYGHTKIFVLETPAIVGQFMPVFSSFDACKDYLECRGEKQVIYKKRLKDVMKYLDSGYPMRDFGVVIDPHLAFVAIPATVRVTPKSLRY